MTPTPPDTAHPARPAPLTSHAPARNYHAHTRLRGIPAARTRKGPSVAIRAKLTTLGDAPGAPTRSGADKPKAERSDEEKAKRKERVEKAKDALARSATLKGDHVPPARAALKTFLQRLNEANQPDDAVFEALIEAPFKAPPKKKTDSGFGGRGR